MAMLLKGAEVDRQGERLTEASGESRIEYPEFQQRKRNEQAKGTDKPQPVA